MAGHDGFRSLGELIAGGDPRRGEAAFLEGLNTGSQIRSRNAATESALAQARLRRDEAKARTELGSLGADIVPTSTQIGLANLNPEQFSGAALDLQQQGFRDIIADPTTARDIRQFTAQAASPSVVNPLQFGPGGELLTDVFSPDPLGTVQVTPTGSAAIEADQALAESRRASASLTRAKEANPGAFKSTFNFSTSAVDADGNPLPLGDAIAASVSESTIDPTLDPREATGVRGLLRSASNIPFDIVNANLPFRDTSKAEEAMLQYSTRITVEGTQAMPGRPNITLLKLMQDFGLKPNDPFRGNQRSVDRLQETSRFFGGQIDAIQSQLNFSGPNMTKSDRSKFERSLRSLIALKQDGDVILSRFEATGAANTTDEGGSFTLAPTQ